MSERRIEKFFNTAGPAQMDIHYTLNPLRRVNYEEISRLIDQRKYFVLHAPRQTGKTTSLLAIVDKINSEGRYYCVYVNVEAAQTACNDVMSAMRVIMTGLGEAVDSSFGEKKFLPAFLHFSKKPAVTKHYHPY